VEEILRGRSPPHRLTSSEIDREVALALEFRPALTEFIIATTAPDDVALQAHVRAITERHEEHGLFSVHVLSWNELTRRLTKHEKLVQKHFGYAGVGALRADLVELRQSLPGQVVEALKAQVPGGIGLDASATGLNAEYDRQLDEFRDLASTGKAATARRLPL
jgi:hypothetical protein